MLHSITHSIIRIMRRLIKKHVDQGYRPMIVCSAMGKTTNSLISAGDFALSGQVRDTVVWCDVM